MQDLCGGSWAKVTPRSPAADCERPTMGIDLNKNLEEPLSLSLATPSFSSPSATARHLPEKENPNPVLQCNSPPIIIGDDTSPAAMAFQRADPRPFVPRTMVWQDIVNRPTMVRAVASRRAPRRNEDLAIVNIAPLPGIALDFENMDDVLTEFFELRKVAITDIQPCCLGQAYVRFARRFDRDALIGQGPIVFDNVTLTFIRHNEGRNWRRVHFNTECWLMILGFPPDYQEEEFYQNAISSFGRLLYIQQEEGRLTRVIIRARVIDLQSIPHFIVFAESEGFESDSWTVQCEILQHNLLRGGPQDEDPVPELAVGDGAPFDFFGLGQPGAGLVLGEQEQQQEQPEGQDLQQFFQNVQEDNAA